MAVAGAAAAAGGTALALKATAGAPVYWPRWKRQATEAAAARVDELRTQLVDARARARAFGDEWVEGAKAPARGARTAWRGARDMAGAGVPLWASAGRGPGARTGTGAPSANGSAGATRAGA